MKNINKKILLTILTIITLVILSGCTPNDGVNNINNLAGFWDGVWHGIIAPISWVMSWFNPEVGIYEVFNNGGWYNFGFLLGIGGLSSGVSVKTSKN